MNNIIPLIKIISKILHSCKISLNILMQTFKIMYNLSIFPIINNYRQVITKDLIKIKIYAIKLNIINYNINSYKTSQVNLIKKTYSYICKILTMLQI